MSLKVSRIPTLNVFGCMYFVLVAHALEVLHRQQARVHESVDTASQARLLALVQGVALDGARDTLLEAHLRQLVGPCN